MNKRYIFLFFICWLQAAFNQSIVRNIWLTDQKTHTFSSPQWYFRQVGEKEWLPAKVPSVVHTDLYENGKIAAPFFGENEKKLQWVGEKDWEYQTTFELEAVDLQASHLELVCEGIDTYSEILINEKKVLNTQNMFLQYEKEVKSYLKEGENTIRIRFFNAIDSTQKLAKNYAYPLPEGENGRVFVRKSAYHFGWDWGPKFVTCGVWKPMYLRIWNEIRLIDIQLVQQQIDTSRAVVQVNATIFSELENQKCYFLSTRRVRRGFYQLL